MHPLESSAAHFTGRTLGTATESAGTHRIFGSAKLLVIHCLLLDSLIHSLLRSVTRKLSFPN